MKAQDRFPELIDLNEKTQVARDGSFARVNFFGEGFAFLNFVGHWDIGIRFDVASKEPVMRFPKVGCGYKRLIWRMKLNEELMNKTSAACLECVAVLINEARLEMLKRSRN